MKIKLSELKQIIKEEAYRFKKAIELKRELDEINKELNEVYAGEQMAAGDTGVHDGQKKPVFKKKGGALVETGSEEEEMSIDGEEMPSAETDLDSSVAANESGMISKEDVAKALQDLKNSLALPEVPEDDDLDGEIALGGGDDSEEVELDVDDDGAEAGSSEEVPSELPAAEETPVDNDDSASSEDENKKDEEPIEEQQPVAESAPAVTEEADAIAEQAAINESEEKLRWAVLAGLKQREDLL